MKAKILIRSALFMLGLLLALLCVQGCLFDGVTEANLLTVVVNPSSGYPPLDITITCGGVVGGQYSYIVEGHTYTQGSNVKHVTLHLLPCEGEVVWERPGYVTLRAQFYVALDNEGPVIGVPRLNGLEDLWYIHPRYRYIVDFPDAYDPDGGPVTLVDAHVQVARKGIVEDTVFCPPYTGIHPPIPDVYHALDRNHRLIENAFVFSSTWTGMLDLAGVQTESHTGGYTGLPFSPPGYGESGYPFNTCSEWPKVSQPATTTLLTATFQDVDGAETTESWTIPTGPDPGCNTY